MSKVNIKVFALPTEKASNIYKTDRFYNYNEGIEREPLNCTNYLLCATTSETPKSGDYIIRGNGQNGIRKVLAIHGENLLCTDEWDGKYVESEFAIKDCRKVVATDDKYLKEATSIGNQGTAMFNPLPQISPEFQQAWVRKMNNNTPIVDAMMEMEGIITSSTWEYDEPEFYRPKLNPQGYVTILPVKEKMYSKTEMIDYGKLAFEVGRNFQLTGENNLLEIEQNL